MTISLLIDTAGGSNFEGYGLRNVGTLHVGGSATATETLEVTGTVGISSTLKVGTINEVTAAAGVTIEGVLIKDSIVTANALLASSNDSGAIGASGTAFSDLFLASGAVINFVAGDMLITHSANTLTVSGGTWATAALTATTITGSGILSIDNTTDATSGTTGSIHTDGGLGVAKALWVATTSRLVGAVTMSAAATVAGILSVDDTTDTTSTTTGSIHTDGGAAIALNLWVGVDANIVGTLYVNETENANMTIGLTINQGANDNQIFCLKSSDVATGLTTIAAAPVEIDDFVTFDKLFSAEGGLLLQTLVESTINRAFQLESWSGPPATTDTTTSTAAIFLTAGEHNNSNARQDMAADSNLFAIAEIDSGGTRQTRLLLKADDGELHLGNTTLVALADDEEDPQFSRAMIRERYPEQIEDDPYYMPQYDYNWLQRLGVVGEKDEHGEFLIRVQPYLGMHDMEIWWLYVHQKELEATLLDRIEQLERLLPAA